MGTESNIVTNTTVLDAIWLDGTNDYQQRIPRASQEGVARVQKELFAPNNRHLWNEFVDKLINRVGLTILHSRIWKNPLAQFKRGNLEYGSSIQEIANKLVKARGYEIDDDTLFRINRPDSKVAYHTVNRQDRYDISVNNVELRKAFLTEGGLASYVSSILDIPITSDNYDEYLTMLQLFAEYEAKTGFYKQKISDITRGNKDAATEFVEYVRAYAGKLQFLSSSYNAAGVPVHANPEELVLFVTPEINATIDVGVLSAAFNVSFAEVTTRVVLVDKFPIPNCQAILCTNDFFVCADYVYETTSFYNPQTLGTNYYLHHWGVYSVSPFMPAIMFTTEESTQLPVIEQKLTKLNISVDKEQIKSGGTVTITTSLEGTITPDNENINLEPKSVLYDLTCKEPIFDEEGEVTGYKPVQLNARTYVDRMGVLHTQKTLPHGAIIEINATSTYINPSGETIPLTDKIEVEIRDPYFDVIVDDDDDEDEGEGGGEGGDDNGDEGEE